MTADILLLCSWVPIDTFLADGRRLSAALGVTDVVSAVAIPAPSPGDVFWSHKARSEVTATCVIFTAPPRRSKNAATEPDKTTALHLLACCKKNAEGCCL